MKQINSFYTKGIFLFFSLLVCVYLFIIILSPFVRNSQVYVAATLDKEQRMDTLGSPRLFFVGGSGLSLGLDSYMISKRTGYKVNNMGVHAALGLPFMLNEAMAGIHKKDVIVLSLEYFLDEGDKKLQAQLVDINPTTKLYLNYSKVDEVKYVVQQLQRCLSGTFYKILHADRLDQIYRRSSFNKLGDLTAHYGKDKPTTLGDNNTFKQVTFANGISRINEFLDVANEKGALVYFTFPAYSQSAYIRNKKAIERYYVECKSQLKCPVLGTPKESVLPDNYFFDTVYHLDSLGIRKRTNAMTTLLIRYRAVQVLNK